MQEPKRLSFSERLGWWGVMRVVWCAIPWRFRLFVSPYCLFVYRGFLANCTDVDEVKSMHIEHCYESRVFRLFRPRFRIIKRALLSLDMEPADQTVQKAATTVLPIPGIREERRSPAHSEAT